MNITVKTRHMNTSEAITQYVESKCDRLPRYYDGIQTVEVILDHEADKAVTEIVVTARKKHTFVASHRDSDMYASIDQCLDKIAQQLRRFKDRVRDRQGASLSSLAEPGIAASEDQDEADEV